MSLPAALRAIADRIEAAEAAYGAAMGDLAALLADPDGLVSDRAPIIPEVFPDASVVADEGAGGEAERSAGQVAGVRAPAPAGTPAPALPPSAFDPLGPATVTCPECLRPFKRQGLAPHRKKKHGVEGHGRLRPGRTNGAPAPVLHKGAERWMCSRCPEGFTTRADRDLHQASHPPIPDVAPVRRVGGGA